MSALRSDLAHATRAMSLGVLTASIAHEVNQPLAGIVANAGTSLRMLANDPPNIEGARETAKRTLRDANRAADVVVRLRSLFGKKETSSNAVNLNEAAREVLALLSGDLQRNSVVLRADLAEDLPLVRGDRVSFSKSSSTSWATRRRRCGRWKDRPRKLLVATALNSDGCAQLTVKDSGVGLDPTTASRLFEAFYTTKSSGMGIGLFVSRSIIESHEGRLWAAPNDGEAGATFSFSIPCFVPAENGTRIERTGQAAKPKGLSKFA